MKKTLLSILLAGTLIGGCDSETEFGKCVGIAQDDRRDPNLFYDLSIWNVFWGVVGFEIIFPPILVLHHELYCPTGKRPALPSTPPTMEAPLVIPADPTIDHLPSRHAAPTNVLGETKAR